MAFNIFAELSKEAKSKTDVKQSELTYIDVSKLVPSEDNFYSTTDVSDLVAAIELVGRVTQNLTVTPIQGTDTYKIIEGHRRHKASTQLVAEGKEQYTLVPCIIKKAAITDAEKTLEEIQLICSNSATRKLSDYEKTTQVAKLKELIDKLKAEGYEVSGRTRDIIAKALNTSSAKVGRLVSIDSNLSDNFKKEMAEENIGVSVAYELSTLPEQEQQQAYDAYKESGELTLRDIKKPKPNPKKKASSAPAKQTAPQAKTSAILEETIHELKILSEFFAAVQDGTKKFEYRQNDRNFKVGDTLILREWSGKAYTGKKVKAKVTYILRGEQINMLNQNITCELLPFDWVIMSINVI